MANWVSPVRDRTQSDVDFAKEQLALGNNTADFKGCLNYTDLTRIENNTRYIADRLNVLKYTNTIETKSWTIQGIPDITAITRIINNVSEIMDAYYRPDDAPDLPDTLLTYTQVNDVEQILYMIKHLVDEEENAFRYCGTFNCGEDW